MVTVNNSQYIYIYSWEKGFTFGTVVRDRALILTGLRTEAVGLLICIVVGYIGGLAAAPAAMRQTPWPTHEMLSRGDRSALYM
jgi:hypothetical protein